jgi:hypothetical protein
MSDRLHKALSRDPKIELGSLVAPSVTCTQSKGEALELTFPSRELLRGWRPLLLPAMPDDAIGGWLQNLLPIRQRNRQLILLPHIKV